MLAGKDWKDFQSCFKQPALPDKAPQRRKKIINKKSQMNQKWGGRGGRALGRAVYQDVSKSDPNPQCWTSKFTLDTLDLPRTLATLDT
jgi:hypothetical protein